MFLLELLQQLTEIVISSFAGKRVSSSRFTTGNLIFGEQPTCRIRYYYHTSELGSWSHWIGRQPDTTSMGLRGTLFAMYVSDAADGRSEQIGLPTTPTTNGMALNATTFVPVPYIQTNKLRTSQDYGMQASSRTAGIAPNTSLSPFGYYDRPHTRPLPGPYGISNPANRSSAQFGLARTTTAMGTASGPSVNTPVSFNLGDLLRASLYYNSQIA
ncbi:hypothetical protein ACOSQ2_015141 [Xanthoceras sorbifolium]